jgi:hypothetical protein
MPELISLRFRDDWNSLCDLGPSHATQEGTREVGVWMILRASVQKE